MPKQFVFKPFSQGEMRRLEMKDLSALRAVLEIELEEKIQERIALMDEWADGVYTYEEAKERDALLAADIADLQETLSH